MTCHFASSNGGWAVAVDALDQYNVSFTDCGMGVYKVDGALAGQVRVTTSMSGHREEARRHIAFSDGEQDEYFQKIQIAELNSLNATIAVMRWRINGFYLDLEHEHNHNTVYVVDGNSVINGAGDGDAHHDQP